MVAETGGPVRVGGQQIPILQRVAVRPAIRRRKRVRRRSGLARRHMLAQRLPEGRIDFIGVTRSGRHRPRRQQVIAIVEDQPRLIAQLLFQRPLGIAPPRLVMMQRVDFVRAGRFDNFGQLPDDAPPAQDEPRPQILQTCFQFFQ